MKLYRVTAIKWDEDSVGDADDLPTSAYVHADDEDEVTDLLSDELGFCILSLEIEEATEALVFPS
jgi:hypothetical protein